MELNVPALFATVVYDQAALAGKWQGQTNNEAQIVLDLAVNKTELTGTFTRNGLTSPIAEGKVSKNTLSFKATLGDQTEAFSRELDGEQFRLWMDRQDGKEF